MSPWMRVDANVARSRLVDVLRTSCGLSKVGAVGTVVCLWAECTLAGNAGYIGELSDAWIEDAAGWTGEPGKLAAVIRERHLTGGRIKDWDEFQGLLEQRREADAARKRAEREAEKLRTSGGQSAGRPTDDRRTSSRNVDVDVTRTTNDDDDARARLRARLPDDLDRTALDKVLAAVPDPVSWVRELLAMLDGMAGHHQTDAATLGNVLREYRANPERAPNLSRFKGYVRKAARRPNDAEPEAGYSRIAEQQMENILGPNWRTAQGGT